MKKKFIGVIVLLAAGVSGSALLYQGGIIQASTLNDIQLANVEALVDEETEGGKPCYNTITSDDARSVRYCPSCEKVPGIDVWYSPKSSC